MNSTSGCRTSGSCASNLLPYSQNLLPAPTTPLCFVERTLKFRPILVPQTLFHHWQSFHEPVAEGINLVPDGYVEFATATGIVACFLEVDLGHESRAVWKEKARRYLQLALSGAYQTNFGRERFRVLVVTHSERKLHSIRKTVAEITHKIFWFASAASLKKDFFAPVWLRPAEETNKSILDTPR